MDRQGRERNEMCVAHGPGWTKGDVESTRIIGLRQFLKAKQLYQSADRKLEIPDLDFGHAWIDMSNTTVRLADGSLAQTCKPARGYSFAAGTTDGPGAFDFVQGDNSTGKPLWNFVRNMIATPTREQTQCHSPKPILLDTGETKFPYPWEPTIVDIQILRMGNLLILGVPGEFTTMAGRRLRNAVKDVFVKSGVIAEENVEIVIAGLSNSYSGYTATFEEYQMQRYEGASTIYGPHALEAYIQEFQRVALQMVSKSSTDPVALDLLASAHNATEEPADFSKKLITLLPPVIFDSVPLMKKFGQVIDDVQEHYNPGETVEAKFYAGHPRNVATNASMQLEHTFMAVEKYIGPSVDTLRARLESWIRTNATPSEFAVNVQIRASEDPHVLLIDVTKGAKKAAANMTQADEPIVNSDIVKRDVYGSYMAMVANGDLLILGKDDTAALESATPLWVMIRDDNDWDTRFHWWKDIPGISSISYTRLEWDIGPLPTKADGLVDTDREMLAQEPIDGSYRLHYYGANKGPLGKIHEHEGVSEVFAVGSGNWTRSFSFVY